MNFCIQKVLNYFSALIIYQVFNQVVLLVACDFSLDEDKAKTVSSYTHTVKCCLTVYFHKHHRSDGYSTDHKIVSIKG